MLARALRYSAFSGLALSGAALAWRASHGPYHVFVLPVTSPLNAQSVFGLCATVLLLLGSRRHEPKLEMPLRHAWLWLLLILALSAAALWTAARFPLVFDDYTLARYGEQMNRAAVKSYFTQPGGDGFFRPVGYLSFGLDALWAGRDPLRWHLTGLILHLANITLVWLLARRLLAHRVAALWAAALFAVHGTVLLTPTYLAARFDVLAVFFVLGGLALFLRYLDAHSLPLLAAGLVFLLLALWTKETAYCFPFLAALLAGRQGMEHKRALAACFALTAAAFAYRLSLFHGLGGYPGSSNFFLSLLKGFALRIWSAFYFPLNWSRPLEPWLTLVLLIALLTLGRITRQADGSRRAYCIALGFTILALLPLAQFLLVDDTLLAAGRFYLALAGFAMFLGAALGALPIRERWAAGAILVLFQLAALRHNETIWRETAALADQTCAAATRFDTLARASSLPREINGVPFLGNGFEACVVFHQSGGAAGPAPSPTP